MDSYSHIGTMSELSVRFVLGTTDGTVPIELTEAFHGALQGAGYDSTLIPVEGAGHMAPASAATEAGAIAIGVIQEVASTPAP
jgi:pimeloyl-ACP methyl ester carboxylesterase